jgi:hypothetical protein
LNATGARETQAHSEPEQSRVRARQLMKRVYSYIADLNSFSKTWTLHINPALEV